MLLIDLYENFHMLTRDERGNWLNHGVDEIMDDIDGEKTILKQSPYRYGQTGAYLTVYPEIYYDSPQKGFAIEMGFRQARIKQNFQDEAVPVIQFILNRWPAYADFMDDETGLTFAEIAEIKPLRMADQHNWFHGTTSIHVPNILRLGLQPRDTSERNYRGIGGSQAGLVYLGAEENGARLHAENAATQFGGAPTVLQIDLSGLENRIVDDHDVRYTGLGKKDFDAGDVTSRRVAARPGDSSYRTIGTIAFKGRVPPNRITVVWQGKERLGRQQKHNYQYQFINQLGALAKQLTKGQLGELFRVIGLRISGWGPEPYYADEYYADPEKTINSVYSRKSQPRQFARWLNGMRIRLARWRRYTPTETVADIMRLIDQTYDEVAG